MCGSWFLIGLLLPKESSVPTNMNTKISNYFREEAQFYVQLLAVLLWGQYLPSVVREPYIIMENSSAKKFFNVDGAKSKIIPGEEEFSIQFATLLLNFENFM